MIRKVDKIVAPPKLFKKLEDTDLMPFGMYKGKPMEDVPAAYLHYLWQNGLKNQTTTSDVADYIERNLDIENKLHWTENWLILEEDEQWYFSDPEGDNFGPYPNKEEARKQLIEYAEKFWT